MRWSSFSSIASIALSCYIVNSAVSLIVVNCHANNERVQFHGHRLYRIRPTTLKHYQILRDIVNEEGYGFWGNAGTADDYRVDIMVSPGKLTKFKNLCNEERLVIRLLMNDVQRFIDKENPCSNGNCTRDQFGWNAYYNLDGIYSWMKTLASDYPNLISSLVGGESYEGRKIRGVKLSFREGNPGVFIEAGIHSREWIAPAVVTYMLNKLITSTDANIRKVAESYDWYVFPVCNPDGYVYTHTTNRLWRKTRKPYTRQCVGADPNRNWNFHWNESGTSSDPCSEIFAGSSAFSERETKTLSEFITSVKDKFFVYLAFHSYSQLILIPYGVTTVNVSNYDDLMQIGNAAAVALAKRYGTNYTVGNIVQLISAASGSSLDWVRGTLNTPVTFGYELRDQGRYGFLLPANQIIPSGKETLDSLVGLLHEANELGYGVQATRGAENPTYCNL